MYTAEYDGINSFLVGAARMLLEFGIERNTRGYKCWELPEPIMIKLEIHYPDGLLYHVESGIYFYLMQSLFG